MSNPNTRLKQIIKDLPVTYDSIAEESGISKSTWQRAVKSGGHIGIDLLTFLSSKYDIKTDFIVSGEKSVPTSGQNNDAKSTSHYKSVQLTAHSDRVKEEIDWFNHDEFVAVPFYPGVYASAGTGLIAENEESLPISFRKYFFSVTIRATAANCFLIRIKGDSMHPLYPDGSDLLIDRARQRIKEGPGFLVRIEDTLYCKLLAKLPGGKIQMRSINEDYREVEIDPKAQGFEIIGEVVWHAQKSKYI